MSHFEPNPVCPKGPEALQSKQPFLDGIAGAQSKELLGRDEDAQVLHGFPSEENAQACLGTNLFTDDVVGELKSLLEADLEVRIYSVA